MERESDGTSESHLGQEKQHQFAIKNLDSSRYGAGVKSRSRLRAVANSLLDDGVFLVIA
jgi:hypothetical protein